jgi:hypothetical protein
MTTSETHTDPLIGPLRGKKPYEVVSPCMVGESCELPKFVPFGGKHD